MKTLNHYQEETWWRLHARLWTTFVSILVWTSSELAWFSSKKYMTAAGIYPTKQCVQKMITLNVLYFYKYYYFTMYANWNIYFENKKLIAAIFIINYLIILYWNQDLQDLWHKTSPLVSELATSQNNFISLRPSSCFFVSGFQMVILKELCSLFYGTTSCIALFSNPEPAKYNQFRILFSHEPYQY